MTSVLGMLLSFAVLSSILLIIIATVCCLDIEDGIWSNSDITGPSRVLSRKKRFLVFPEGSSLQLVFCLTYPSVNIGDIILWGNTAALAWELPQDPYSPFDHHADPLHRRQDSPTKKKSSISPKAVYYIDSKRNLLFQVPYKRKAIVNPAFAKRSIGNMSENTKYVTAQPEAEMKLLRNRMHERQAARHFLKIEHLSDNSIEFHRHSRKELFEKLEVFLKALGMNGGQCVLKMLCEVGQTQSGAQGNFIEELVRAVFTLPKGQDFDTLYHHEYDLAHKADEDCSILYPECIDTNLPPEIMLY